MGGHPYVRMKFSWVSAFPPPETSIIPAEFDPSPRYVAAAIFSRQQSNKPTT